LNTGECKKSFPFIFGIVILAQQLPNSGHLMKANPFVILTFTGFKISSSARLLRI